MLEIRDLRAYYDQSEALSGLNIDVHDGQICCIIGSNGAGKSTLLKAISGMVRRTGSIKWDGTELIGMNSRQIARAGLAQSPEGRMVFPGLSVYHNLEMGTVPWHGFFSNKPFGEDIEQVYQLFPRLRERKNQGAWSLSGGEQQMLAIGRALMARPKLLLLDEPSMGLAPLVVEEIYEKIVQINETGVPILLVEQNARLALKVSHYAYVIEQGVIRFEGPSEDLRDDPRIVEAYLGTLARH